ncbi:MAG: mevalonate kinase [Thaumarchaeota archaeon]|nr:mevalonate kinase [Nitrososphaerota archaeon]
MTAVASAPGKVILFGEHFVLYGVKAVLCAIDRRITARSHAIGERLIRIKSSMGNAEFVPSSADIINAHPIFMRPFLTIAEQALREFGADGGIEMEFESEIPPGMGLGSSSAACVAAAASVAALFRKKTKDEILDMAIKSERTMFEDASGADSAVSTFGGLVTFSSEGREKIDYEDGLGLIIANSNQAHSTRELVLRVREFRSNNERLFAEMCDLEDRLVDEALTALRKNDLVTLGTLMSKNHEMLRRINVSTDVLDKLVAEACNTSYGAKLTGAGGGGCIIALVDESNTARTLETLKKISDCFVARIDLRGVCNE